MVLQIWRIKQTRRVSSGKTNAWRGEQGRTGWVCYSGAVFALILNESCPSLFLQDTLLSYSATSISFAMKRHDKCSYTSAVSMTQCHDAINFKMQKNTAHETAARVTWKPVLLESHGFLMKLVMYWFDSLTNWPSPYIYSAYWSMQGGSAIANSAVKV